MAFCECLQVTERAVIENSTHFFLWILMTLTCFPMIYSSDFVCCVDDVFWIESGDEMKWKKEGNVLRSFGQDL